MMLCLTLLLFQKKWVEPEIILPQAELEFPEQEDGSDDEDVQVDFQPRRLLNTNFQAYNSLPQINQKTSRKRKRSFGEYQNPQKKLFASFGIKVTVERAEIGPSVTKYEVKAGRWCRGQPHFQSSR